MVAASLAAFDLLGTAAGDALRRALRDNTHYFRAAMTQAGFNIRPGKYKLYLPVSVPCAAVLLRRG